MERTHNNGELRSINIGEKVSLIGLGFKTKKFR